MAAQTIAAQVQRQLENMSARWNVYDVPAGRQIPGSKLYRMYCSGCGEPVRVNASDIFITLPGGVPLVLGVHCTDCRPSKPPIGAGGGNAAVEKATIQYEGGNFYSGEW